MPKTQSLSLELAALADELDRSPCDLEFVRKTLYNVSDYLMQRDEITGDVRDLPDFWYVPPEETEPSLCCGCYCGHAWTQEAIDACIAHRPDDWNGKCAYQGQYPLPLEK